MKGCGPSHVLFNNELGELSSTQVQPIGGRRPSRLDGIAVRLAQGHEAVVAFDIWKIEARHPLDGGQSLVPGPEQRVCQGRDGLSRRCAVEAADSDIYRVNRAAAHDLHDQVSCALEVQTTLDCSPVALGQLYGIGATEKVGRVQEIDVKGVALDPFAAVKQPAQGTDALVDNDPASVLHGGTGTHLVGHRADAADARCDVRRFGKASPHQHCLEVARGLEDLEGNFTHDAVVHLDPQ